MTTESPKCRRWFQFRLRTLLIAILVLSLPLSWFGARLRKARRQREAVKAIERLGGSVTYEWELVPPSPSGIQPRPNMSWLQILLGDENSDEMCSVSFYGHGFTDVQVRQLSLFGNLTDVMLKDTRVTDAGLDELAGLTRLESLVIIEGEITDDGLRHLGRFSNLSDLVLIGTQFSNDGLKHLAGVKRLRRLRLGTMRITDAGVEYLEGLCNLKELWFHEVHISDAGLGYLANLESLEQLHMTQTFVTPEGVRKLQESLPECWITLPPDIPY